MTEVLKYFFLGIEQSREENSIVLYLKSKLIIEVINVKKGYNAANIVE